jgi:plastocyanin
MPVPKSIVMILCAVATCALGAHPAWAAAIRGVVVYTGSVNAKKLPVTIDQYVCGKDKPADDLVVGAQRGVRSAVVWLKTPPAGASWPTAPVKVEMDQRSCVFVPRVVLVPAGGTVEFLNSDRLLHNLHGAPKVNSPFNRTQPKGRTISIAFARPELIRVDCDLHSWMRGWIVVADHPFYAITGDTGRFTFDNVPPGQYTLQIWHERLGRRTSTVTVAGDGPTPVNIELKAR